MGRGRGCNADVLNTKNLVENADSVQLGKDGLQALVNGVVLAKCPDPFSGLTRQQLGGTSTVVLASE